jgi:hypothetical protein
MKVIRTRVRCFRTRTGKVFVDDQLADENPKLREEVSSLQYIAPLTRVHQQCDMLHH